MRQRGGASDAVPTQTPRYTNMAHSVAAWPRRRTDAKPRSSSWQHRLHEQRGGTGTRGATARCTAHAARLRGGLVAHGGAQGFERRGLAGRGSLAQREVYSGVGSVSLRSMSSHTRRWLLACVLLVLLPRRGSGQETPIWMSLDSARDTPAQPDAETEVSCPCMIYEPQNYGGRVSVSTKNVYAYESSGCGCGDEQRFQGVGHPTAVRHHLEKPISRLVVGRDDCSSVFDVHVVGCEEDDRACGYFLDVHAPADLQVLTLALTGLH